MPEPKSTSRQINSAPTALLVEAESSKKVFLEGKIGRAQKENCKGNFCEVAAGALAEAGGGTENVRFSFHHHALCTWHIVSDFENRF